MIKKGTTRIVFLIGGYAIKLPRINRWKSFLRGILANLDERLWYKNSTAEWKIKMCPALFCFGGWILICKRAAIINDEDFMLVKKEDFYPIPFDPKPSNFGYYKERLVIVDYADSRYFCSDCEEILKRKTCSCEL